jgi:hypothetical protein
MALTVYNKTSYDITATLSAMQSSPLSAEGSWQPSDTPTSFKLVITFPLGSTEREFGPEITSATFQRTGQVFGIVLQPSE